jgi:DNA invertase Pin-like site-specific DNA recombinase|tara:strand:+ start:1231 stop:1758 length:528 start_codon:yes stop_codon:yes gene_type:complete
MEKTRIAIILRKSPTKNTEIGLDVQKFEILKKIYSDFKKEEITIVTYSDVAKGDSVNRPSLTRLFKRIPEFKYAYCYNVDRFSRSWLGIKWLHEYFTDGCQLRFVTSLGLLYAANGTLNHDTYLQFFILCGFAQYELLRIRSRIKTGIERIKADPKLRAEKYKGGSKGRSWAKSK